MHFETLLNVGRGALAAQRKATLDADIAAAEKKYAATVKHWTTLVDCIKRSLPECLHPFCNFDLDMELERSEQAKASQYDEFHGEYDNMPATRSFILRINPPSCTEISTRFHFHDGAWKHWTLQKPSGLEGTYKIARHIKDIGRGDEYKWYVVEKGQLYVNDLPEALALAEEAYKDRNVLLLECEQLNADLAAQRAAREAKRASKPPMTTAEVFLDALTAFIDERQQE